MFSWGRVNWNVGGRGVTQGKYVKELILNSGAQRKRCGRNEVVVVKVTMAGLRGITDGDSVKPNERLRGKGWIIKVVGEK